MQSQGHPGGGHWHSANDIASKGSYYIGDNTIYVYINLSIYLNLQSGVWRQWDGTLLSWTPWWSQIEVNEPSGADGQNCAGISIGWGEWAGKWWTAGCDAPTTRQYICERDL